MTILFKAELLKIIDNPDDGLYIDPLIDKSSQIGEISVDLRLGYDFYVSVLTRNPSIDLDPALPAGRGIATHFQSTRRDIGDKFVMYPGQVVLGTSLEYLSLPKNLYAEVTLRSSYLRLGLSSQSFIQPGYRGCISLELFNHGNVPIELVVGSRFVQGRFFKVNADTEYLSSDRKYHSIVRPTLSKANDDIDLKRLKKISSSKINTQVT